MHVDDVCLGVEVIVPDILEQHRAGDHLAVMPHQILEQPEFTWLQRDLAAVARELVGEAIELEPADPVNGLFTVPVALAARQDLDPREQFGKGIGLGQVIVAARTQAFDPIVDLAERR